MHEYTETVSKYTSKIGTLACGNKCTYCFEVKKYAEQSKAKKFLNFKKINILLMVIITVQIFSLC